MRTLKCWYGTSGSIPVWFADCGHTKTFHAWLRTEDMPVSEPAVIFGRCDHNICQCDQYTQAVIRKVGSND